MLAGIPQIAFTILPSMVSVSFIIFVKFSLPNIRIMLPAVINSVAVMKIPDKRILQIDRMAGTLLYPIATRMKILHMMMVWKPKSIRLILYAVRITIATAEKIPVVSQNLRERRF